MGRIASGREAVAAKEGADVEALGANARRLLQKINVRCLLHWVWVCARAPVRVMCVCVCV